MFMDRKNQYGQDVSCTQLVYKFSEIPIKIPASNFINNDTPNLKFQCGGKKKNFKLTMNRGEFSQFDKNYLQKICS